MTFSIPKKHTATPAGRFLAAFFDAIGAPAVWLWRPRLVAWPVGDTLNHLRVYDGYGDLPRAPRITRIAVNCAALDLSGQDLLSLGFRRTDRPAERRDLRLELTVLDEELAALPAWLALLLAGRIDRTRTIPASPIATDLDADDLRVSDYGWSVAAWDAHLAWRAEEDAKEAAHRARRHALLGARIGPAGAPASPSGTTSVSTAVPGVEVLP